MVRNKFDTKYNLIAETEPSDDIYKEYIDYAQKRLFKENEDYVKDVQDRNPILRRLDTLDEGDRGTVTTTTPTFQQQAVRPSEGKFSSLGRFTTPVNLNRSRTTSMLSGLSSYPFSGLESIAGTTNNTPRNLSSRSLSTYQNTAPTSPNFLNLTSNLSYLPTSNVNPNSPSSSPSPNLNGLGRKKILSKSVKILFKKYNL